MFPTLPNQKSWVQIACKGEFIISLVCNLSGLFGVDPSKAGSLRCLLNIFRRELNRVRSLQRSRRSLMARFIFAISIHFSLREARVRAHLPSRSPSSNENLIVLSFALWISKSSLSLRSLYWTSDRVLVKQRRKNVSLKVYHHFSLQLKKRNLWGM